MAWSYIKSLCMIRPPSIPEIKYTYLLNRSMWHLWDPIFRNHHNFFKTKNTLYHIFFSNAMHCISLLKFMWKPLPPLFTILHKILLNSLSIPHTSSSFHLSLPPPPLSHFLFVLHSLTPTPSLSLCLIEGITRALMP